MKHIQISIDLTDELGIKSASVNYNDTGLKSDSELVIKVAYALLQSFSVNKDEVLLQDLLRDVNISVEK